ncbi:MAG: hypothetical protein HQL36_10500, partial [Alphaproteobacteria bacterium]|nr:hypothetical protein [Alphaproteobacteria bacterium]
MKTTRANRVFRPGIPVATLFFVLLAAPFAKAQVAPHSTPDCKRFHLKLNKQTGEWECLYKTDQARDNASRRAKELERQQR